MDNFSQNWDIFNFASRQYASFMQGSLAVSTKMMETYTQAWTEFFFAPQTLTQRNLSYFQEVTTPAKPTWHSPYRVLTLPRPHSLLVKLLDFSLPQTDQKAMVPTLVLPPQAGHHSSIADYNTEQSQVMTLAQTGLNPIYCIEWLSATQQTRHASIEEYVEVVRYCVEKIGGKANLVGDCQGGWLAAIYAAIYPDTVNSLTVAGAPIDFQAGDGQIKESVNFIARNYPDKGMSFYRNLVAMNDGLLDGGFLVGGFNLMKPEQLPDRFLHLYQTIDKPHTLKRFQDMKNWFDSTQNIAGAFYLWLVEHLFRDNELILGKLEVGGRRVDLGRITCPTFMLGGTRDHITPPVQVFALTDYIGTPANLTRKHTIEAGHIGLFMGKDSLSRAWKPLALEIAAFS